MVLISYIIIESLLLYNLKWKPLKTQSSQVYSFAFLCSQPSSPNRISLSRLAGLTLRTAQLSSPIPVPKVSPPTTNVTPAMWMLVRPPPWPTALAVPDSLSTRPSRPQPICHFIDAWPRHREQNMALSTRLWMLPKSTTGTASTTWDTGLTMPCLLRLPSALLLCRFWLFLRSFERRNGWSQ